jgi:LuxR family transcriptional regulator, maltose regulon positive regulatory protein
MNAKKYFRFSPSMSTPILATKLYIPPLRSNVVLRPHLIERLNDGLSSGHRLTLISAPAGFGKTTLVSEWVASLWRRPPHRPNVLSEGQPCSQPVAWLSLDEGDNDSSRFLAYLIVALQTIKANFGEAVLGMLHAPQPPPIESILTTLLNEIAATPSPFVLVLDDYHAIDAQSVDHALTFLIEHLPPQMHLVIATREDPALPLARLRARGQMTELRAADLRFTPSEAAGFLNQVMGLNLSAEDITALETRTEGWIAGLQLAALSMQGQKDTTHFIQSFTGSHHFVLDYLLEEVLHQQSESVQAFLLHTSILDRMCGPLCDAVMLPPSASGQETLEYLEHANLFIIPLDNERRWYRYHHLFAELLRQRLHQNAASFRGNEEQSVAEYHIRASVWYEDNRLEIEAFHHAAAANDIERAERLMESGGMPLHFRGAVIAILDWLGSLPTTVLDARPSLWSKYASMLLVTGQTTGVEEKLQAAETALQSAEPDDRPRNLIGQIAAARATLALTHYQVETMITQSQRALEYLNSDNLPFRATINWILGVAYTFQRDHTAACRAFTEAISISQVCGDIFTTILATFGLAQVQESENQLYMAAETYRRGLQLSGDHPLPSACEAHLGLARIFYEWNNLDAAQQYGEQSLQLARQYESVIDRFIICEVFLARLKLARGDAAGAAAVLTQVEQSARQHNFAQRIPEISAVQVLTLLHQGNLAAAADLAQTHALPISQARVHLAQGGPSAALALLEPLRQQAEAMGWQDERLQVMVLQAVAYQTHGEKDRAVQLLGEMLALAEPGGFIRIFVDEGLPMAQLLSEAAARRIMPDYVGKLLAAFEAEAQTNENKSDLTSALLEGHRDGGLLIEPLSQRELEVLQLIARGLSNHEISEKLFLALDTVKGHNRRIYDKLQVQRRTEAVARAHELGLL